MKAWRSWKEGRKVNPDTKYELAANRLASGADGAGKLGPSISLQPFNLRRRGNIFTLSLNISYPQIFRTSTSILGDISSDED